MIRIIDPTLTEKQIIKIQSLPATYERARGNLLTMAEESGQPVGEWHVENWLKKAFKNEGQAERFVDGYFGYGGVSSWGGS